MAENLTDVEQQLVTAVDTSYLILTGINILVMQAGFLALEAGGTRAKNVKSLLFKNFMDHAVGSLAWFTIGWGLFIGTDPFAAGPTSTWFVHPITDYARLFQQFAFAATAATIVSGAVTGRCRLEPYVVLSAFMSGITYPIAAHWAWSDGGFLRHLGFLDFAGSAVVHAFGGAAALAAAWACGPRPGRFISNKRTRMNNSHTLSNSDPSHHVAHPNVAQIEDVETGRTTTPLPLKSYKRFLKGSCCRRCSPRVYQTRVVPKGHNPPMMALGALLLYIAWFSFNAGSAGSIYAYPDSAVRAAVNTLLAGGAASVTCMLFTVLVRVKYDIEVACNCMLSGLVAITAPSGFVDPWAAVVAGVVATPLYVVSAWFVLHVMGVDDVLGAVSVHLTNGVWGTLWLGFTHPVVGFFYSGHPGFLGVQALGCLLMFVFPFITTLLFVALPFKFFGMLNYTESEQLIGIDFVHFGGEFGKDVDLESDGHRRNSITSERDNDTESANSGFVEEYQLGADRSEHNQDRFSVNMPVSAPSSAPSSAPVTPQGSHLGTKEDHARLVRAVSTNTIEGRKLVHHELRRVLDEDSRVRHRFRAYLEVMHREEGVAFWDDVLRWKKINAKKTPDKKIKEAKRIIKTYCLESGTKQVNLASRTAKSFLSSLDDREDLLSSKLFDDALDELFRDLKVAFTEFIEQTPNYWM